MADFQIYKCAERDTEQAIIALKKGSHLLKYGRRGKPKFCPFWLSNDETLLIWYAGKQQKRLKLSHVSRIIPGQRTSIFQRYPQPEKEYQSFSLIYSGRSLDLICKDKEEAEVWFAALGALISRGKDCKSRNDSVASESPQSIAQRSSLSFVPRTSNDIVYKDPEDTRTVLDPNESSPQNLLGKAFSDIVSYSAAAKAYTQAESVSKSPSLLTSEGLDNTHGRTSASDTFRISLSSGVSSCSQGSSYEDFDALHDVFIWGEGIGDGLLGGGVHKVGSSFATRIDALMPKALESTIILDAQNIACGSKHAVLVTKQRQVFSWGDGVGGRLGHGVEADVSKPKLIDTLSGSNIELVACGEFHTCAVTLSGDLYTWGDGTHNVGLLGHASEVSHWTPKKVSGQIQGLQVSCISCGPWHTAAVTSAGKLFTFGDGAFGSLGHGDRSSTTIPREVETLKGLRTVRASCGVWHTAAVVDVTAEISSSGSSSAGKLFTWGDGDKGQLGHGDKEPRLFPSCVTMSDDTSFCQVACGHSITIALTVSGQVYAMGSADFGQLGSSESVVMLPTCIVGNMKNSCIEEIACGSHHVAVLSSKAEVYTWGKGLNGQLGHGDNVNRDTPKLVEALRDKQVKRVVCGSNYTAVICLHKWVSNTDNSICSNCRNPFNFRRKRHNCYNCGLVFCKECSNKKSLKASLAPNLNKPYRVCDDCFTKLKRAIEPGSTSQNSKISSGSIHHSIEVIDKDALNRRSLRQLARLTSFDSLKHAENQQSYHNRKLELNNGSVSAISNRSFQWESTSILIRPRKSSASVPGSRMVSRATSPIPRKSSPVHSESATSGFSDIEHSEVIGDYSKRTNESLTEEVTILKAQVEDLTHKVQLLQAKVERTSRQLSEATLTAGKKAEKNNAAKQVILSLTAQLKDMAEKIPEQSNDLGKSDSLAEVTSLTRTSTESHLISRNCLEQESTGNIITPVLSNGSKEKSEKVERVVKDEPGVYITISSLPGGRNLFERVRFSRKYFSEQQAEEWWAANRIKVFERHNIENIENSESVS